MTGEIFTLSAYRGQVRSADTEARTGARPGQIR